LTQTAPLRVLVVEDRESDARLMVEELKQAGLHPVWDRVETESDYLARLEPAPDVILSDYHLPQFDAERALHLLREQRLDIPFIIVSGSIGEDRAVKIMRDGAADYLLKDRLGRLGQAVTQALEQRSLRESLRQTERRLQQLVSATPAVIYALKYDGDAYVPTWVSQSIEHLTGFEHTCFLQSQWWLEHVHPEDLPRALDVMFTLATRGSCSIEYRFRCCDGNYRWLFDQKRLIRDAMGVPVEVVGSWLDITEQKRLEDQLRQAQKMEAVGRLAGGVAHDFNNLLTVIAGYGELAFDGLREGDPIRDYIDEIRKASGRAAALTRQLLAFSRRQILVPAVVDFNKLIAETQKLLGRLIGEDIDLVIDPATDLWTVRVDPGQMEQVIMNLVVNSHDAMPQGGKLTIETANVELDENDTVSRQLARPGEYVRLSVSDTGCGMDSATQARVFEPFFTTKPAEQGTGLGLATVYGIVMQSGGHIELYSELGLGTTFKIYIPRCRDDVTPESAQPAAQEPPLGCETVLLVEDEEGVRTLARMALEKNGYTVLEARHPQEALKLLEGHQGAVQILVSDVVMPHMSGRQLAERLLPARPDMKVLYISGYTDDAVVRHGLLDATTPFLQKPFTPDTLARTVRSILDGNAR
jgi:PAS domain S-box-containing protein